MGQVLRFWYLQSPQWVYHRFLATIRTLDGHFAVGETLRHLSSPIFQDYTFQGRVIGFVLRIFRVLGSVVFYFLAFLVYIFFYLLWLLFPVICLGSLVGAFLA